MRFSLRPMAKLYKATNGPVSKAKSQHPIVLPQQHKRKDELYQCGGKSRGGVNDTIGNSVDVTGKARKDLLAVQPGTFTPETVQNMGVQTAPYVKRKALCYLNRIYIQEDTTQQRNAGACNRQNNHTGNIQIALSIIHQIFIDNRRPHADGA